MCDPVIVTQSLTRRFGDVETGTLAVDELSLTVGRGEVFGFLGHNGAGKTTTVRLLNGVLAASAGTMRVLGLDPAVDGAALRRRTGVLTETPALDEQLTAREQLALYASLYAVPVDEVAGRVATLLADFDLAARADEPVGGFSKGMKQRLALARTLIHEPEVLFLDEPTGGLDPVAARQVHTLIRQLSQGDGRTVFLCTHNLNEAQQLCDRVAVMEHGKLVAIGSPHELAQDLWKGVRLEIESGLASEAVVRATVQAFPGVREATVVRTASATSLLTCWLPAREQIPDLLHAIVTAGGRVYRLSPRDPSLEDVYFALHGD